MREVILIILLSLVSNLILSQDKLIRGVVINNETKEAIPYTNVFIDSLKGTITDENGCFQLKVKEIKQLDTLKIRFVGYLNLNFTKIPDNLDTINLDTIPMFEYFAGVDMAEFFCGPFDFRCKKNARKHRKKEFEREKKYYESRDDEIMKETLMFFGKKYSIDTENNCINLNNPIDK